jgi:hypothetical protein
MCAVYAVKPVLSANKRACFIFRQNSIDCMYYFTNCIEQSPWEASGHAASPEIPFMEPKHSLLCLQTLCNGPCPEPG